VSPPPAPLALARLRELLLDVATGGSSSLREGLEGFRSWSCLATLCGSEWTAGTRRSSLAARRVLQRRLRALGTAPVSVEAAAAMPVGSMVHVRGSIRPVHPLDAAEGGLKSHIWSHSAMNTDNVRGVTEEGHDFFLTDVSKNGRGETLCVMVARGHLVNADALVAGDRASVFGFTDVVARRAPGSPGPGREPRMLALRSGDDLPLLVRKLAREP
jgi:hypothetical protein